MQISIVIPLFNEDESLPELHVWIQQVMNQNQFSYEILFVDDGSKDKSWAVIQSLEQKYSVDLLDKMNVTFKLGEHIAHKPLIDFKKMVKDKAVTENTIVFNNLVNNVEEYNESWEVAAIDSWHSRFF